ncbi:MAG TPA: hypothetical protein PKI41_02815 [Candidatus Competibacteraceae bacterium]|nr:hypothetical protein [Candidatus Competibacteraceae bacterium]HQA25818.1 hypothetical protein [Candidatus Competibacteraceae bacterium]HQD55833.1 hypothetical protein [Candidatus Competibacteraceae bacterium]
MTRTVPTTHIPPSLHLGPLPWLGMALLLAVLMFPAHAQQISDAKVEALVEALRLSAPKPGPNGGLYSDWQVKPDNITRWSKRCLNQEVTPEQFAADQALARQILACVMGKVLREQVAAGNNEIVAVQRSAAWWMTGDPEQYNSGSTSAYTLRVLEAYLRFF